MIPRDNREDGVIYTDMIGIEDKVFILKFGIEGITDLNRFREQSKTSVAAVANGQRVPYPAQRTSRNRSGRRR
jgi:hypothetical protein